MNYEPNCLTGLTPQAYTDRKTGMQEAHQATVDAAIAAVGSKATYGGAATSVLGWLFSSQFSVVVGILIGIAGLAVNWYYRAKQDRREQAAHDKRMAEK